MARRGIAMLLALALALAACGSDDGVDVRGAAGPQAPPRDARLVEADWPAAAAWIERELDAGRPVVMNVLASWCGPCERELPLLNEAARDNEDIAFLGVDHLDQRESAEAFLEENDVVFPTLFDPAGEIAPAIGGRVMPTTAFFATDGTMVARHAGELSASELQARLDEIRPE